MSASGGNMRRRQKALKAALRWLWLPVLTGALVWIWVYFHMSAQAWTRAVVEPLFNHNRFGMSEVWIGWDSNSIETMDFNNAVFGFKKSITARNLILKKRQGDLIADLMWYRYPQGEVELQFVKLAVPVEIVKALPVAIPCGDDKEEFCEFSGSAIVSVHADRSVSIVELSKLQNSKNQQYLADDYVLVIKEKLNSLSLKERF